MTSLLRRTVYVLIALTLAIAAQAQSVHWENGDSGAATVVQLVFEDCEPDGDPQLPQIPNATLSLAGSSTSVNMVNMSVTRTLTLSYVLQTRRAGPVAIPAFTIKTNKGALKVAAFTANGPTVSAESLASSKLSADKTSVWAGEVFELKYQLTAARRTNPQFGPSFSFDWNSSPAVTEEWSKPSVAEAVVAGERSIVITTTTRGYIKTPNTVKLDAAQQVLHVQTGTSNFGLFVQPRMEAISVTSDQPTIEVRPLPAAPPAFTSAVGHFKLTSKVVPREAAVGEPITWTLELSGTGNWPDVAGLPSREVSKDFQVVQPKAKRVNADGKLFDATLTEDVVLVPTKPGEYSLGPVTFVFFNPESGQYETLRTDRVQVVVNAPANAPTATPPEHNASNGQPAAKSAAPAHAPATIQAPAGIPRDPLPGHESALAPMSTVALVAWLLAPLGGVILVWLALAWRRALRNDPLRPRREAHARLTQILGDLATTTANSPRDAARIKMLLGQWQHETAVVWNLPYAAPNAATLLPAAPEWAALWREAERVLYAADATLPADWVARAEAALEAKTIRPFNPFCLFLPRNLLAFAAAVTLLLAACPHPSFAADAVPSPEASYRAGDFAAAENAWRTRLAEHPTDWAARHNLALALAQQDRNNEAMAHAIAAFVQHPTHPSVRWHLAFLAGKAGYAPAVLQPFLKEGPAATLATLASPAVWQRVLVACAFVLAAAIAWLLVNAYGQRAKWATVAAAILGVAAFFTGAGAIFGIVAYGNTVDTRAVVAWETGTLRSIPTEADTTQKTSALPAGSIAVVDKTFLGWVRLSFDNGQTGWVRKSEVVPLWRAAP